MPKARRPGALAAELAGVIINDNLVRSEGWQERQAQISRVAGAFAGAIVTAKAAGATSGANAGEFVERFNRQLHQEELNAIKELAKGDKGKRSASDGGFMPKSRLHHARGVELRRTQAV